MTAWLGIVIKSLRALAVGVGGGGLKAERASEAHAPGRRRIDRCQIADRDCAADTAGAAAPVRVACTTFALRER